MKPRGENFETGPQQVQTAVRGVGSFLDHTISFHL